jgi:hypothetical protein
VGWGGIRPIANVEVQSRSTRCRVQGANVQTTLTRGDVGDESNPSNTWRIVLRVAKLPRLRLTLEAGRSAPGTTVTAESFAMDRYGSGRWPGASPSFFRDERDVPLSFG